MVNENNDDQWEVYGFFKDRIINTRTREIIAHDMDSDVAELIVKLHNENLFETNTTADPLMTKSEWERERAKTQCSTFGHDLEIVVKLGQPTMLVCQRPCGHPKWDVTPRVDNGNDS